MDPGSSSQDIFQAGTFGVSLRASGAHLIVDTYVSNAGTQLTSFGQKRHVTHTGPQLTLVQKLMLVMQGPNWPLVVKNVTPLTWGPNLPFCFLDCYSTVLIWLNDFIGFWAKQRTGWQTGLDSPNRLLWLLPKATAKNQKENWNVSSEQVENGCSIKMSLFHQVAGGTGWANILQDYTDTNLKISIKYY